MDMNNIPMRQKYPGSFVREGFLSFEASATLTWLAVYVWPGVIVGQGYQQPGIGAAAGTIVGLIIAIQLGAATSNAGTGRRPRRARC